MDFEVPRCGSDVLMPLDVCTAPGIGEEEARGGDAARPPGGSRGAGSGGRRPARRGVLSRGASCSASCRGTSTPSCATASAARTSHSTCPATPSAASRWARSSRCSAISRTSRPRLLPRDKPRYLMGIGTPLYILEAIEAGVDMFDCVLPTRTARNAQVFTADGPIDLRNETYRLDFRPIDEACRCPTCTGAHPRLPAPPLQGEGDPGSGTRHGAQPRVPAGPGPRRTGRHRAGGVQ